MGGSSNTWNERGCQQVIHAVAWAVCTFAALIYMYSKLYATQFKHLPDIVMLSPGRHGGAGGGHEISMGRDSRRGGGNAAHSILKEGQYGRCQDGRG